MTIKSIVYGKEGSGHRTSTLEKLAKAFNCSVSSLVSEDNDEKDQQVDTDLFKQCLDAVASYCERKEIVCERNKMMRVVENVVSLYSKKKAKNISYVIDDDTIEWLMGNL